MPNAINAFFAGLMVPLLIFNVRMFLQKPEWPRLIGPLCCVGSIIINVMVIFV